MSAREICGHKPKSVTGEGNRTPGIDQHNGLPSQKGLPLRHTEVGYLNKIRFISEEKVCVCGRGEVSGSLDKENGFG